MDELACDDRKEVFKRSSKGAGRQLDEYGRNIQEAQKRVMIHTMGNAKE